MAIGLLTAHAWLQLQKQDISQENQAKSYEQKLGRRGGRGSRCRRGRGRSLRVLGGPGRRGRCFGAHGGRGCWSDGCHGGSRRSGNGRVGRGTRRRRSLRPGPRHGLGAGEHALPASAGQRGRGRAGRPVRQQHERRHAAPQAAAPRSLASESNHTPRPFSWGLNPVTLPQSQPNSRASSRSSGRQSRLPPPSYDQLARDIEAA